MRIPDGRLYLYRELIAPTQERDNSMQQATTLRTSARTTISRSMVTAVLVLMVLATIAVLGLSTRAPHAAPVTAVVVTPGHNRLFDSEGTYVPSASEYVSLGETYAPAADYATGAWGEDYRIAPAQPAPAVVAPSLDNGSRLFADQSLDVVSAAEYALLPLAEDYSLAGTPR